MGKRFLTVWLTVIACLWARSLIAETLEIPGSGACEVVLKELAKTFNVQYAGPGHEVIIPSSIGSTGGIKAVMSDKNLVARVSRLLEGDETKQGLQYLVFAKDAVVFAVGAKVEIQGLSSAQLVDIFSGKIDNWQQVGGPKEFILVLVRQAGETSLKIIQQHIKPFQKLTFTDCCKFLYHDYEVVDLLTKYRTAIGWLTLSSIYGTRPSIRPIAIDHISPAPENVMDGRHKLVCDYALVYKENRINQLSKKFVNFIFSDSGREIMKKHGLNPMGRR